MPVTLHLICNAHIDPVWLWDRREGLNEGISTCRAMVTLLDEFPEATFIRGESAIYRHIERHDRRLFADIHRLVDAGRWDVVGGTLIQPDNNLPGTEPLLRQFVEGKGWFRGKFNREVTVAWATDAFGHSGGLPDILQAAGIDSFACTRPWDIHFPIAKSAFWWTGAGGARVLAYRPRHGWYGTNRDLVAKRLDEAMAEAESTGLSNVACFIGLGDHGGGTSRRHLREIQSWREAHPGVRVVYSGLHRLFAALRAELRGKAAVALPEVGGEMNFCLRGCSASVAKFKFAYRRAQAGVLRAERTAAAAAACVNAKPASLERAWHGLLFNAFHDILPGSSVERAYDEQLAQIGGCLDEATEGETDALMDLAADIDTTPAHWHVSDDAPAPVPVLVWNPHPWPVARHLEIETGLDYRPLFEFKGRVEEVPLQVLDGDGELLRHQVIKVENDCVPDLPWRARVVTRLELPPMGWRLVHVGLNGHKPSRRRQPGAAKAMGTHAISNGALSVSAPPGGKAVHFLDRNQPWLPDGLQVRLYEDEWGSWGGMGEEPDSWLLTRELERWTVTTTQVLEEGPLRVALWIRFEGARSRLDLILRLSDGERHLEADARVLFNERCARLKIILPSGGGADYAVPGGEVHRKPCGEVPGIRWVRAGKGASRVGFASDSLHGFDTTDDEFGATIARASRYASEMRRPAHDQPWMPAVDAGELRFRFLLTPEAREIERLSAVLEEPVVVMPVPARRGARPTSGSVMELLMPHCELLALRCLRRGEFELRLRNCGENRALAVRWLGARLALGRVAAGAIVTWRITHGGSVWRAARTRAA